MRTTGVQLPATSLSGGNQQKVVLARELSKPVVSLFIASQPTRGVDVGAIEFVHKRVIAERDAGVAVLIVSTELDEVAALADRVVGHVPRQDHRHRPAGDPARRPGPDDGRRPAGGRGRTALRGPAERAGGRAVSGTDLMTEVTAPGPEPKKSRRGWVDQLVLYALSFLLALVISGILIAFADPDVRERGHVLLLRPDGHPQRRVGRRCPRPTRPSSPARSSTSAPTRWATRSSPSPRPSTPPPP